MSVTRDAPDLESLVRTLAANRVRYVVTGSTAALLLGVELSPGDFDITPDLDAANLRRLRAALDTIDARPDPDGPFGDWVLQPDGERRWIEREARPGEREARLAWHPDPRRPRDFDALLTTRYGNLDVVPEIAGRFDDLSSRALTVTVFGYPVLVESIEDQLATLTVARRAKDRDRTLALRALQRAG